MTLHGRREVINYYYLVKDGTTLTSNLYDEDGRQTRLTDANAGATEYSYNAFGELTWQKSAKNEEHNMSYDVAGRITSRSGPEGTTSYEYYTTDDTAANLKVSSKR